MVKFRNVEIRLHKLSQPIEFDNVLSTYQKGDMFCVNVIENQLKHRIYKFPIHDIFIVIEDY